LEKEAKGTSSAVAEKIAATHLMQDKLPAFNQVMKNYQENFELKKNFWESAVAVCLASKQLEIEKKRANLAK
jgi:hypothetical protein